MLKKTPVLLLLLLFCRNTVSAQYIDSLRIYVGTTGTVASKDYQPLWIVANRFGVIEDRKSDLASYIRLANSHVLFTKKSTSAQSGRDSSSSVVKKGLLSYGANFNYNQHFQQGVFQQAYAKLSFNGWELRGGRFEHIVGENDPDLSSGSLGVSGNALPIPQIQAILTEYKNIPFTNGWLQFKGSFSHGWMGNNRYMKDSYLHQKTFYGRIGKNKLKLFGGIQHFAEWGGGRKEWTTLDRSWKGFLNVILVREADDGSVDFGLPRDDLKHRPNKAGDHRGAVEIGGEWENDKIGFKLYHQTPFDMGQGITPKNIDKLLGLTIVNKNPDFLLKKLVLEFIHTKQMTSFDAARHRESYYNNGVYRTGWEYEDRIIGTPLMVNRIRASKYFDDVVPFDWDRAGTTSPNGNIMNNRIVGGHAGFILAAGNTLRTKTLLTYVRHYPGFGNQGPFSPVKKQWYSLQEVSWHPKGNLSFKGGLAYDFGELSKNVGGLLGVEWQVFRK